MNWRACLKGRRVGNYQLTLREQLVLLGHILFSWHTAIGLALLALGYLLFHSPMWIAGDRWFSTIGSPSSRDIVPAVIGFVLGLLCYLAAAASLSYDSKRRGNAALRRMGFPICVKCQYDLKGLEGDQRADRCPECGTLFADMPPVGKPTHTCE